jgi:hypothetical protein
LFGGRPAFDPDQIRCLLPSSRLQLIIPNRSKQTPLPRRGYRPVARLVASLVIKESAGVRKGAPVAKHAYTFA